MNYTSFILTTLTIITGVLTVVSFYNGRKKDTKKDGEREATLRSDLQYIKDVLLDVRRETKEINQSIDNHSQRLAQIEEQVKSAYIRIDHLEKRIDKEF